MASNLPTPPKPPTPASKTTPIKTDNIPILLAEVKKSAIPKEHRYTVETIVLTWRPLRSFLNKEYSDITIICSDKAFPAHRLVLCSQSAYFRKACSGNFKVVIALSS